MRKDDTEAKTFRRAVESGDADAVRTLLRENDELGATIDEPWFAFASPALVHAAGMMNRALVDTLLDAGADPDARSAWDNGPYSALHRCVDGATPERIELAEHLLSRGATLDLHTAAGLGRVDAIVAMLDAAPERVSEPGPDGATPLHLARDVATAQFLVQRGADIDKRCIDHHSTPAQWALGDRPEVTRLLLEHGARADLFMAAGLNDVELAARILESEPSAIDVHVSFGKSHEHLGWGDKYNWSLDFAGTPQELARRRGNAEVYAFLLARSSSAVQLLQAARRGDLTRIEALLQAEPDLIPSLDPDTAREILCGTTEAARLLLDAGADPNARDEANGATALHYAAYENDRAHVELLLSYGADPGIRDNSYDGAPSGWAQHAGNASLAQFLRERAGQN